MEKQNSQQDIPKIEPPFQILSRRMSAVNENNEEIISVLKSTISRIKNVTINYRDTKPCPTEREKTMFEEFDEHISIQERQTMDLQALVLTLRNLI